MHPRVYVTTQCNSNFWSTLDRRVTTPFLTLMFSMRRFVEIMRFLRVFHFWPLTSGGQKCCGFIYFLYQFWSSENLLISPENQLCDVRAHNFTTSSASPDNCAKLTYLIKMYHRGHTVLGSRKITGINMYNIIGKRGVPCFSEPEQKSALWWSNWFRTCTVSLTKSANLTECKYRTLKSLLESSLSIWY